VNSASRLQTSLSALAPRRPIVVIQSDDWGRVGIPSLKALDDLREAGIKVGASRWDHYGLESEDDLVQLGKLLAGIADCDGNSPCLTANFVMANADLGRMREERYDAFRWIGIGEGFPKPWADNLMPAYRALIARGHFEPALHGFTHFNVLELLACLREESERGERARLLVKNEVPYLASVTPDYNFALVSRQGGEHFMSERDQADWISTGVKLFTDAFGIKPATACAPGYRANLVTRKLWQQAGIESAQVVGTQPVSEKGGLVETQRNVSFEPALYDGDVVGRARAEARRAVRKGLPIVICSHSINYITRFTAAAETGRAALRKLLTGLLEEFPSLRFASTKSLAESWKAASQDWFCGPTLTQRLRRVGTT
jgi:hypothetical protein